MPENLRETSRLWIYIHLNFDKNVVDKAQTRHRFGMAESYPKTLQSPFVTLGLNQIINRRCLRPIQLIVEVVETKTVDAARETTVECASCRRVQTLSERVTHFHTHDESRPANLFHTRPTNRQLHNH